MSEPSSEGKMWTFTAHFGRARCIGPQSACLSMRLFEFSMQMYAKLLTVRAPSPCGCPFKLRASRRGLQYCYMSRRSDGDACVILRHDRFKAFDFDAQVDSYFSIEQRQTTFTREIRAGTVTFLTVSFVTSVIPSISSQF